METEIPPERSDFCRTDPEVTSYILTAGSSVVTIIELRAEWYVTLQTGSSMEKHPSSPTYHWCFPVEAIFVEKLSMTS